MRFSFFGWLRAKAHEAVIAGIGDALEDLDADEPGVDLDALRKRLTAGTAKQLPAPDEETGGKRKKTG